MPEVAVTTMSEEIGTLQIKVKQALESMDKSDKTRLLAIAVTHLETAKLFAREAGE